MKFKRVFWPLAALLAGCSNPPAEKKTHTFTPAEIARVPGVTTPTAPPPTARAQTIEAYKEILAQHISDVNRSKTYSVRPQALLRSVVVLRFVLDADGKLVRSEIVRSNRDKVTEASALASLRGAAPLPVPPAKLLARGRLEISETWLFNNDGRFQLRSIALPQMSE